MTKKFQAIVQLCSFHLLARLGSKSFKLGFSSMSKLRTSRCTRWISKTQRKQRSNWQHLLDHGESKGVPENIYLCFTDCAKVLDCVDHHKLWKILKFQEFKFKFLNIGVQNSCTPISGVQDYLTYLPRNLYMGQETTEQDMEQLTGSKRGKENDQAAYFILLI